MDLIASEGTKQYVVRHYDKEWSAEDIEKARMELLVRVNGADRVRKMVRRGTWPVDA